MDKPVLCKSEEWALAKADPMTPDIIVQRVAEGETLKEICKSRHWPYSFVAKWLAENPELNNAYENALSIWGDALAQETLSIADAAAHAENPHDVSAAKVRIDARMKLASRWHRQRYGDTPSVTVNAQSGSLVSILAALPSIGAPEEELQPEAIDVTPKREQKERVVPMELKDKKNDDLI